MQDPAALHRRAIVIDGTCPLLRNPAHMHLYREGGVTAGAMTVGSTQPAAETLRQIGHILTAIRQRPEMVVVRSAAEIEAAKRDGKFGVILQFQGTDPIENDLDLVEAWQELGIRMVQLTYNVKNRVGDGCEERTDSGLSNFGLNLIRRLNDARMLVDCSHTGYRTTMDAIAASKRPVVFSHANARAVHPSPRNILDDQARAVADTGGLVGVVGFPAFVGPDPRPSMAQFIAHIDYWAELLGIDHVGLGIDYYEWQHPLADPAAATAFYRTLIAEGRWSTQSYPPPPYHYPEGIETPTGLPNLTAALLARGWAEADVLKVMGGNWLRVFREVWGA